MLFLLKLLFSPVRIGLFVGRTFGYGRLIVFLLGMAAGLLLAPTTGAELRDRLREMASGQPEEGEVHERLGTRAAA